MKRRWNLPNMPVYSLATCNEEGCVNMNICTYVSAVSMKPKRYMITAYHNTQTFYNVTKTKTCVLQLLGIQHVTLVNGLGKKSGLRFNKQHYLTKRALLFEWNGFSVLADCAALVKVTKVWSKNVGDHTLFVFAVKHFRTNHKQVLMLDDLRARKLVRI